MPQVLLIGLIILIVIFAIFTGYVLITFLIYMVIKFVKNIINYISLISYVSIVKEKYNIDLKINNLSKNLLESQKRLSEARQFELDNNNEILDYQQKLTELKIIEQKCENIYVTSDEMYDLGKKYNAYEPIISNIVLLKIEKERLETKIDRLEGKIKFIEKSVNAPMKSDGTYNERYKDGKDANRNIATINEKISELSDDVEDYEESIDNEITKIIDEINDYTRRIEEIIRIKTKSEYEEVQIIEALITSLEFARSELVTSSIFILMLGIFYNLSLFINISWLETSITYFSILSLESLNYFAIKNIFASMFLASVFFIVIYLWKAKDDTDIVKLDIPIFIISILITSVLVYFQMTHPNGVVSSNITNDVNSTSQQSEINTSSENKRVLHTDDNQTHLKSELNTTASHQFIFDTSNLKLSNDEYIALKEISPEFNSADKEITDTYNALRSRLSPEAKKILKEDEIRWLNSIEKNLQNVGPKGSPTYINRLIEIAKERIEYLKNYNTNQ